LWPFSADPIVLLVPQFPEMPRVKSLAVVFEGNRLCNGPRRFPRNQVAAIKKPRAIRREDLAVPLTVVGNGEFRQRVEQLLHIGHLQDRVWLKGGRAGVNREATGHVPVFAAAHVPVDDDDRPLMLEKEFHGSSRDWS
jgi:hypothetical protein